MGDVIKLPQRNKPVPTLRELVDRVHELAKSSENFRFDHGLQGERHGRANLTDEVVRQIRAANGSHAELEKRFRVPRTTIYNVRKHVTWRHLS